MAKTLKPLSRQGGGRGGGYPPLRGSKGVQRDKNDDLPSFAHQGVKSHQKPHTTDLKVIQKSMDLPMVAHQTPKSHQKVIKTP